MLFRKTNTLTFLITLFAVLTASAQEKSVPLEKRRVYGQVFNERHEPVLGATVSLYSPLDTLHTIPDAQGIYEFEEVRSADFLLTIRAMGFSIYNRRYFNNDTKAQLLLPTIFLGVKVEELEEVTISRLRGSVVRGDTTEFWAADYIVRDFARLKDLLMRMEGITIDAEGSVFYNGEEVTKALFNNEVYFSGSVRDAIRELPADIVARVQIIDRAADGMAARQVQSEETTKVMNIVSKEDKSAGTMLDIMASGGTQSRMRGGAAYRQIDGADQTTASLGYRTFPAGVRFLPVPGTIGTRFRGTRAEGSGSPESGGRYRETEAGLGHSLVWKNLSLSPNYSFDHEDNESETRTFSQRYHTEGTLTAQTERERHSRQQLHRLDTRLRKEGVGEDTYQGSIEFAYSRFRESLRQTEARSGIIESRENETADRSGQQRRAILRMNYQRAPGDKFNLSFNGFSSSNFETGSGGIRTEIVSLDEPLAAPDSTVHQLRESRTHALSNKVSGKFSWAMTGRLTTQFAVDIDHRNMSKDIRTRILDGAVSAPSDRLSEQVDYHWIWAPFTIAPEYSFSNGFFVAPAVALNNHWAIARFKAGTAGMARYDLLLSPDFTMGIRNAKVGNLSLKASRTPKQLMMEALNPDPVYRTPFSVEIGDPNLRPSLEQKVELRYSRLFREAAFNVSTSLTFTRTLRGLGTDRSVEIDPIANVLTTTDRWINVRGGTGQSYWLMLTKTLGRLQSTLKYNGNLSLRGLPYYSSGEREWRESAFQRHDLTFFYRAAPWLDVTPEFHYLRREDRNSLALSGQDRTHWRTFTADMKLAFFLPAQVRINVDLSQSLHETTNIMSNTSPFVVNANIEKRLLRDNSMVLSLVVMDAARQNRYTAYQSNEFGYTNHVTSPNSRYYLLQLSWMPEYWSRSEQDTGQGRKRDGSFVQ